METFEKTTSTEVYVPSASDQKQVAFDEKTFFPSGAIAFFTVLIILCLIIWFGIYFLMLERS